MRLGVSAVQHDMKREETVEEVEKSTELKRQTPKRNVVRSSRAGGAKAPWWIDHGAFLFGAFLSQVGQELSEADGKEITEQDLELLQAAVAENEVF